MNCPCCNKKLPYPKRVIYNQALQRILQLSACSYCGVRQSLGISQHELDEYYQRSYWNTYAAKGTGYRLRRFVSRVFRLDDVGPSSVYALLQRVCREHHVVLDEVFDIGCGTGGVISYLRRRGVRAYGIEPDKQCAKVVNDAYGAGTVVVGNIEDLTVSRQYRVVLLLDVLEHLRDIEVVMQKAVALLEPGGILVVVSPNCDNNRSLYDSISKHPHLTHFTRRSFRMLMEHSGLRVVHFETASGKNDYDITQFSLWQWVVAGYHLCRWVVFGTDITRREHNGTMVRLAAVKS